MRLHDIRHIPAILVILVGLQTAFCQTSQITGPVSDPSGASVPAASITVTNVGTGVAIPTTTNAAGYYTLPLLVPGEYDITASKAGFKTASRASRTRHHTEEESKLGEGGRTRRGA
jgi:uncharacterized membrane protein